MDARIYYLIKKFKKKHKKNFQIIHCSVIINNNNNTLVDIIRVWDR